MKKKFPVWKKIIVVLGVIVILFVSAALTYRILKTQGVVETYEVNPQVVTPRLIIATQQSNFKDEVIRQVVEELKHEEVNILVTDVTELSKLEDEKWDALVILTTVESGQIQEDSHEFLANHQKDFERIGLVYTADSGKWEKKDIDIDAVSSASRNQNIKTFVQNMVEICYNVLNNIQ